MLGRSCGVTDLAAFSAPPPNLFTLSNAPGALTATRPSIEIVSSNATVMSKRRNHFQIVCIGFNGITSDETFDLVFNNASTFYECPQISKYQVANAKKDIAHVLRQNFRQSLVYGQSCI